MLVFPMGKKGGLSLPDTVSSVSLPDLGFCSGLTAINVASENRCYSSVDGVLFNKNKTKLIRCPAQRSGNFSVPSSVTDFKEEAFSGCKGFATIDLSNCTGLTSLSWGLFMGCTNATITLPAGITSVGDHAFDFDGYNVDSRCQKVIVPNQTIKDLVTGSPSNFPVDRVEVQ